ncbi:MAG: hypothetical protein WDM78_08660 [Puia sp.]
MIVAMVDPTAKPVSREAMKITRLHTSMAFFRCNTGPALSTIVTHTAPIDMVIPIFSWCRYDTDNRRQRETKCYTHALAEVITIYEAAILIAISIYYAQRLTRNA